jgi:hypothetical protein
VAQSEKDRVAREVADLRITFDSALSNKRKYPVAEFNAFVQSARRYIKITPGNILFEADRLECQLFAGYDPSFNGDEPPGL